MKLDCFWILLGINFDTTKTRLMREADAAFYGNENARCIDAISQLYDLFDEEFGSAKLFDRS